MEVDQGASDGLNGGESTLAEELSWGRTELTHMLQPPLQESLVLHPLFRSQRQSSLYNRDAFKTHVQRLKASLKAFRQQPAFILDAPIDANPAASSSFALAPDSRLKRQKILSLIREVSSHSTAICTARKDLHTTSVASQKADGHILGLISDSTSLYEKSENSLVSSREDIEERIKLFAQCIELMAKGIGMETFAEEHIREKGKVYALTLAASILVIDVEIDLAQELPTDLKPNVQLRISYATDGTHSQPRNRDPKLADCLKLDLQRGVTLLLQKQSRLAPSDTRTSITGHLDRFKRNLIALKGIDDYSKDLYTPSQGLSSSPPDLFAALDMFCKALQSQDNEKERQAEIGLGYIRYHTDSPYASIIYHNEPSSSAYHLTVTIKESNTLTSQAIDEESPLPTLGSQLKYTAILNTPVIMPKVLAKELLDATGLRQSESSKSSNIHAKTINGLGRSALLQDIPIQSFEELLSDNANQSGKVIRDTNEIHFGSIRTDAKRQGILISEFPFASIGHLRKCVKILREQVKINEMLSHVTFSPLDDGLDIDQVSLRALLHNESTSSLTKPTNLVSLQFERRRPAILISVPLSPEKYLLEIKLKIDDDESWNLQCAAFSPSDRSRKKFTLQQDDDTYKKFINFLSQRSAEGLDLVISKLREWALENVRESGLKDPTEKQDASSSDVSNTEDKASSESTKKRGSRARSAGNDMSLSDRASPTKRRASQAGIDLDSDEDNSSRGIRRKA